MDIRNKYLLYPIIIALFSLIGFTIYANIYNNEFVFDDINNIRENTSVAIDDLSLKTLKTTLSGGRPIAIFTFALNHFFHGYETAGFHFVNILIHVLNGVVLFYLFSAILNLSGGRKEQSGEVESVGVLIPLAAALIWFVHPIQTQAVTYTVQRMTSLSALFFNLALLCYIFARGADHKRRKFLFLVAGLISFLLAIGSKENALMLPAVIIITEIWFLKGITTSFIKKYWPVLGGLMILFGGFTILWLGDGRMNLILNGYSAYDFDLPERLMTEFRVVLMYLTLLVFPHPDRLHLDYNYPVSTTLMDPLTTLPAILVVFALFAYTVFSLNPKSRVYSRSGLLPFAILWYFVNLFIESSFIPIELVYEHRLYLPSMFFFLVFSRLIFTKIRSLRIPVVGCLVLVSLFSWWTWNRNFAWQNRLTVWQDNIQKMAPKARAFSNYGCALMNENRYGESLAQFEKTLELDPEYESAYNNRGYALYKLGKYTDAISDFQTAVLLKPDYPLALQNWGDALQKLGRHGEALEKYQRALSYDSERVVVLNRIAMIYALAGNYGEAARFFEKIHLLQPENPTVCYNITCLYALMNETDTAVTWLKKAVALGYDKWQNILNDKDLDSIRNTDDYRKLIQNRL